MYITYTYNKSQARHIHMPKKNLDPEAYDILGATDFLFIWMLADMFNALCM